MKAINSGQALAEVGDVIVIEGDHYFPPCSVVTECLLKSSTYTTRSRKGLAYNCQTVIKNQTNPDGAWYYSLESKRVSIKKIRKDFTRLAAFWLGVGV